MTAAVIIDSGGANLASLLFALRRLDVQAEVSTDIALIRAAPRVILPGVGSARDAMERLHRTGLATVLPTLTQPVLGICLGMQLLFARSEEGSTDCLGVFPETVRKLQPAADRAVPHMGWNQLAPRTADPLLAGIEPADYVYFVHSYAVPVCEGTLATAEYGGPLSAVVRRGNFWGTQFHPERSAAAGARILANFLRL